MTGKLIVIDGADGSGKGTQTELLIKRLKEEGRDVLMLDFPRYESNSSYFVQKYLNGEYGSASEVSPKLASLFYALDRFDAKKEIITALRQNKIIISNRYVSSNAGHQGGKIKDEKEREQFLKWLYDLEYAICGLPRPDLNIYLNVPWETGQKLVDKKDPREYVNGKKRDIHEADSSHLRNTQKSFMHLTKIENNWIIIDCIKEDNLLKINEIHEMLYSKIKKNI